MGTCGTCAICLAELDAGDEAFLDECYHHFHLQASRGLSGQACAPASADAAPASLLTPCSASGAGLRRRWRRRAPGRVRSWRARCAAAPLPPPSSTATTAPSGSLLAEGV